MHQRTTSCRFTKGPENSASLGAWRLTSPILSLTKAFAQRSRRRPWRHPLLATAPRRALARRRGLRAAQAAAELAVGLAARRVASRSQRASRQGRARSRLDEIDEEDEGEEEDDEDYSNLDEDSGEAQDSETGQGSEDDD